jgi:hypothetical protein
VTPKKLKRRKSYKRKEQVEENEMGVRSEDKRNNSETICLYGMTGQRAKRPSRVKSERTLFVLG